jgi:catechol 2,3-dioxygenase-like lactoylglutathione lyase family enzyme
MKIDHVGWVTNDIQKFEGFWVKILGFKKIWESNLSPTMTQVLYGLNYGAKCARYQKGEMVVECHVFAQPVRVHKLPFARFGLNHICLHVESRKKFLKQYPFKTRIYHNPKGWDNVFIRDFEGNWIELKEKL